MALPEVGLQAVIEGMSQFEKNSKIITSSFETINKEAGNTEKSTSIFSGLGGVFDTIGKAALVVTGAIAGLSAGFLYLAKQGFDAYAANEQLGKSLESLLAKEIKNIDGTMSLADALVQAKAPAKELQHWIELLAIQSPFESKDLTPIYQLGLNFGFASNAANGLAVGIDGVREAQKQNIITMDRLLTSLTDWATASGKSTFEMENSARALGQMRMTGKVMKEDLNQLTTAGIDWMGILKGMGYSLEDVTKGVVKSDEFISQLVKTLESDFGGAAAKSATSAQGLVSSLSDLKTIGLREFFTGTIEALLPQLSILVSKFQEMIPTFRKWGDELGQAIGKFLDSDTFKSAIKFINDLIQALREGGLGGAIEFIKQKIVDAWPSIQATISQWATKFWNWITEATAGGGDKINTLISSISNWLQQKWPTIAAELNKWMTQFWGWVNGPGGIVETLGDKLDPFLKSMSDWATSKETQDKITELGESIGGFIYDGLLLIIENQKQINKLVLALTKAFFKIGQAVAGAAIELGTSLATGIISGLYKKITGNDMSERTKTGIKEMLRSALNSFIPLLGMGDLYNQLTTIAQKIVDGMKPQISQASQVKDSIKNILSSAFYNIVSLVSSGGGELYDLLTSIGGKIIDGIKSTINSAGNITKIATEIYNNIWAALGQVVTWLSQVGSAIWNQMTTLASWIVYGIGQGLVVVSQITALANQIYSNIWGAINQMVTWLGQVGSAIWQAMATLASWVVYGIGQGFAGLITTMANYLWSLITGAINTVAGWLGGSSANSLGGQFSKSLNASFTAQLPTLSAQLQASVAGPGLVSAPATGAAGNTTINNYYNIGGNTINSNMDAAIFEQRVLDVIRKNL